MERLAGLYWKPVYALIRRAWGRSNEDAKDLAQEFFTRFLVEGDLFSRFTPGLGPFRAFLRSSVLNFLRQSHRDAHTLKRGGNWKPLSTEQDCSDLDDLLIDNAAVSPEEAFDRAWERVVLARAIDLARGRLVAEGHGSWWEAFEAYDLPTAADRPSYEALAERFGIARDTVKVRLARVREELLRAAREILSQTASTADELDRELKALIES
jgi:RNA polymerase sigma factor (sigma-70 family)